MKKRLLVLLIMICTVIGLSSCSGKTINAPVNPDINIGDGGNNNNNNQGNGTTNPGEGEEPGDSTEKPNPGTDNQIPTNVKSTVTLSFLEMEYIPKNEITVIWYKEDGTQYSAVMDETGAASIANIDDEYNIRLENLDEDYTYNPNIYTVDLDSPDVVIELFKIIKPKKGYGYNIQDKTRYKIDSVGAYRAEIKKAYPKVFYEFSPSESGVYLIESYVSTYEDTINPKLELYTYTTLKIESTIDSGGEYVSGGFTKNFKHHWDLSDHNFSSSGGGAVSFIFAVTAENKIGETNMYVDFKITYMEDYFVEDTISSMIIPKEYANASVGICTLDGYKLVNADGGTGSYYESGYTNGNSTLDGSQFKYNEETGFWCKYDPLTGEFGPTLVVYITKPCPYFELSFDHIEDPGNKVLTVNGTENHKQFIEKYYASVCNFDGVCYVTQEMKDFLQKYCTSQKLFIDGEGYIEAYGTYALEENQWLFACAYYVED